MKFSKLTIPLLLAFLASFHGNKAFAQGFSLLSEIREQIVFEELTAEEKIRLAEHTRIIFKDVYVNRFAKQDFYPDLADPLVELDTIVAKAAELSTTELQTRLSKLVRSQRDLHFRYTLPPPYGSYTSFLPLAFERTRRRGNPFEVRVSAVNTELFEQFAPGQRVPEAGDLVVGYNGQATHDFIKTLIPEGQGANTWGGFKRAMDLLTFRIHSIYPLPDANEVSLEMRSRRYGETYAVTVPWVSGQGFAGNLYPTMESQYPSNPSLDEKVTWGLIENRFGTFGYLAINSFGDFSLDLENIRLLLLNELKETDALIVDVRDNPGGSTDSAERLHQFFGGADSEPLEFRVLNNDFTQNLPAIESRGSEIPAALDAVAGTESIYSDSFNSNLKEEINELGQVYFKPVGVLMNARTYSAADLFACKMQDDGRATIYGEDLRTGAGGATLEKSTRFVGAGGIEALPPGNEIDFPFLQAIRTGLNQGQLIEDFGCEADVDVSPVARDLVSGSEAQINKITRDLARRARRFDALSQAQPINDLSVTAIDAEQPVFNISTRGTRSINIYRDNELMKTVPVFSLFDFERVALDLSGVVGSGLNNIVIRGVDYRGKESWNYKPTLIPLDLNFETIQVGEEGVVLDFSRMESIEPLSIFNFNDLEGWVFESPFVQVDSSGSAFPSNSEMVMKLDLSTVDKASMILDIARVNRSRYNDSLDVYVTTDEVFNGTKVSLLPVFEDVDSLSRIGSQFSRDFSGTLELNLDDFVGQKDVYVHFQFAGRANGSSPSIQIGKITVQ